MPPPAAIATSPADDDVTSEELSSSIRNAAKPPLLDHLLFIILYVIVLDKWDRTKRNDRDDPIWVSFSRCNLHAYIKYHFDRKIRLSKFIRFEYWYISYHISIIKSITFAKLCFVKQLTISFINVRFKSWYCDQWRLTIWVLILFWISLFLCSLLSHILNLCHYCGSTNCLLHAPHTIYFCLKKIQWNWFQNFCCCCCCWVSSAWFLNGSHWFFPKSPWFTPKLWITNKSLYLCILLKQSHKHTSNTHKHAHAHPHIWYICIYINTRTARICPASPQTATPYEQTAIQ